MKKGFTCGTFDLCHAGHMLMFKECKNFCDYLIVGLEVDPSLDRPEKNKPVQTLDERRIQLEAIRYIDKIIIYKNEAELYEILAANEDNIDVRVVGSDWEGKEYTGHDLPLPVVFNSRTHSYSSSDLRKRIFEAELQKTNTA